MSDQKQANGQKREDKKGVSPYQWFNGLKTSHNGSLLSKSPPLPTSAMLGTKSLPQGPLEDAQGAVHSSHWLLTPSTLSPSPLKYQGSRGAQGTCAHPIFSFMAPPEKSTVAEERKGLQGRGVQWDMWSKLETWGPQSRKVDQDLPQFRAWKRLNSRARNPDYNS